MNKILSIFLKLSLVMFLTLSFYNKTVAHHVVTGNISYDCVNNQSIDLDLKLVIEDGLGPYLSDIATLQVYFRSFGVDTFSYVTSIGTIDVTITDTFPNLYYVPRLFQGAYHFDFDAFDNDGDYLFVYQVCCRTADYNNIINSDSIGSSIFVQIPFENGNIFCNNSPELIDTSAALITQIGESFSFNLPISELDGDSLVFALSQVFDGAGSSIGNSTDCNTPLPDGPCLPPYSSVPYKTGYSETNPVNNDGQFTLDPLTGLITGQINKVGKHALGITVQEYRNGQYLGDTHFDLSLLTVDGSKCSNNVFFNNQQLVDAFAQTGCTVIEGNLTIYGAEISSLDAMNKIDSVYGNVLVSGYKGLDFNTFNSLKFIGGSLTIQFLGSDELDGFNTLNYIGNNLNLSDIHNTAIISAFEKLQTIEGDFHITRTSVTSLDNFLKLDKIGSSILLNDNTELTSFASIPVSKVQRTISIYRTSIQDLSQLSNLDTILGDFSLYQAVDVSTPINLKFSNLKVVGGSITIYHCALEESEIFPLLQSCSQIKYELISMLEGIDDFHTIKQVRNFISIIDCPDLKQISAFENLEHRTDLNIINNDALLNLVFPNFPENSSFNIQENSVLKIVNLFTTGKSLRQITIAFNPSLATIRGFRQLETVNNSIEIASQGGLQRIYGFDSIKTVGGSLNIRYCSSLDTLSGFHILDYVGKNLYITYTKLTTCDNFCNIITNGIAHYIVIADNLGTCHFNEMCFARLRTTVFYDANGNGSIDFGDFFFDRPQHLITTSPDYLNTNGRYQNNELYLRPDTYEIIPIDTTQWEISTAPISVTFDDYAGIYLQAIPLKPIDTTLNAKTYISLNGSARCGTDEKAFFTYENTGNRPLDGSFSIVLDNKIDFIETDFDPVPDGIYGDSLVWNFSMLAPNFTQTVLLNLTIPNSTFVNEKLNLRSYVYSADLVEFDHFDYNEVILCSYDPNDKKTHPDREGAANYTLLGEKLFYTIRFENIGNAPAINVRIVDTLSEHIDLGTFRLGTSSHSLSHYKLNTENRTIQFLFKDINLGPLVTILGDTIYSDANKGFISFWIQPYENVPELTQIFNKAAIYFDANPPIITNEAINTLVSKIPEVQTSSGSGANALNITYYPNPTSDLIFLSAKEEIKDCYIDIFDVNGKKVKQVLVDISRNDIPIELNDLPSGVYFVKIKTAHRPETSRFKVLKI